MKAYTELARKLIDDAVATQTIGIAPGSDRGICLNRYTLPGGRVVREFAQGLDRGHLRVGLINETRDSWGQPAGTIIPGCAWMSHVV